MESHPGNLHTLDLAITDALGAWTRNPDDLRSEGQVVLDCLHADDSLAAAVLAPDATLGGGLADPAFLTRAHCTRRTMTRRGRCW